MMKARYNHEQFQRFNERVSALSESVEKNKILSIVSIWLGKIKDAERLMYEDKSGYYSSHPDIERRIR